MCMCRYARLILSSGFCLSPVCRRRRFGGMRGAMHWGHPRRFESCHCRLMSGGSVAERLRRCTRTRGEAARATFFPFSLPAPPAFCPHRWRNYTFPDLPHFPAVIVVCPAVFTHANIRAMRREVRTRRSTGRPVFACILCMSRLILRTCAIQAWDTDHSS